MLLTKLRSVPVIVLLVLLAVLVLQAWLDLGAHEVTIDSPASGLDGVSWVGTVADDGRLSVTVTYDFSDEASHRLDIRVPDGARFLALNGTPIEADIGKYAAGEASGGKAVVSYELPGAVTRYRDGALLRLAQLTNGTTSDPSIDGDQGLFPCPRCYVDGIGYGDTPVDGALFVPGADQVALYFLQLDSVRS
ncbi:MAG TPA: hypothetical protein VIH06_12680, partial [Ilumatobacteraceae bacterium]